MSPCCSCSLILNEQTGAHFCGGCGETVASTVIQKTGPNMDSPSLQATEDFSAARSTHPRVSLDDMKAKIGFTHFINAGEASRAVSGLSLEQSAPSLEILTLCLMVMQNGFVIVGKSAPASPENYDQEKGQRFAYEDAIRQLWPLEGYALREKLAA